MKFEEHYRRTNMSKPVSLFDADLSKPFVYQRGAGVFYVSPGYHQHAMALLMALNHNLSCGIDIAEQLELDYPCGVADAWLASEGTAFRSSVGKEIMFQNINLFEERVFKNFNW